MKKFLRRLAYWLRSRRAQSDLAEEIEFHRMMKKEELERAGLPTHDADAASRRELGNILRAREESRDVWGWTWIDHTLRDVAYAWRAILKMPMLAIIVVLSVGIGIGVNTAVFSWIQAMILRPLPGVDRPSSFYLVEPRADSGAYPGASWLEYTDLRERLHAFQDLLAFRGLPVNVGDPDRPERRYGLLVSDNYFSALGLKPALGHFPEKDEVLVSYGFWKSRLNGSLDAVGQTLRINDQLLAIAGVAPEGFQGTVLAVDFDLWAPARLAPSLVAGSRELEDRSQRSYSIIGRLQRGATLASAQAEFADAMLQLARMYPEFSRGFSGEVMPYWRAPRGPQRLLAAGVMLLQVLMLVLLLAVCGNTANLLLARAAARTREVGTRLALGATRWRVVRLLMMESVLLGLFGAALGVLIAIWGTDALRAARITMAIPIRFQTTVNAEGFAVSLLLGIACAVLFGIVPALHLVRGDPQEKLRSNSSSIPSSRLRHTLTATEAALALMVLLAAALFYESFRDARTLDPGFQVEGVLLAAYDLREGSDHRQGDGRIDPAYSLQFANGLLERLSALPGVESAAIASSVPLDIHGMPTTSFISPDGGGSNTPQRGLINVVTPDYFRTMKIPLVAGPGFASLADTTAPAQVVVNEEFRRRFISRGEVIGRQLTLGGKIYGIAGVAKNSSYDSFGEAPIPIMYFSYRDRPRASGEIHVRTRAGSETLLTADVRRIIRELNPGVPLFNVRTFAEQMETNLFLRRIPARLFVVLGPLLLFFAAIGIYSVVAYNVSHRITEIGVRIALGATVRHVVHQIVGETLRVIACGVVAGLFVTLLVYVHVVPGGTINLLVFAGVPALLLAVAGAATWLPARRSAGLDPMIALRHE